MTPVALPSPGPVPEGSPPLRIGLLISSLEAGGAERVCATLANHWARLGHEVTVMTFDANAPDAFSLAPEVHRANIGRGDLSPSMWHRLCKSVDRVRRVRKQLVARHIDVAVAFMSPANLCLAVAGRGLRTVCIGSERTYPPALYLGRVAEWARWALYGWLDAVTALTEDGATWLRQHTRVCAVQVIANPIELPLASAPPTLAPEHWLASNERLVLAAGRLSAEKQFDQLIDAFAAVSPAHPDWRLVVLGEGPLRARLEQQVAALGLAQRVWLPGRAGNMAQWYARADVFALTSAFEGYPNALLEALASGVPAVAYDCLTGPRELVAQGINGLLVPASDRAALARALADLMADGPRRQQLAGQAQATQRAHAIDEIGQRWLSLFQAARLRRGVA